MTIALGLLVKDGIVLAADTEISWTGIARKSEASKLVLYRDADIAIAGSGDVGYIEALSNDIHEEAMRKKSASLGVLLTAIRKIVAKFDREHVLPHKSVEPDLEVSLIIGAVRGGKRALWSTDRSNVRACSVTAVGIGSAEANSILADFLSSSPTSDFDLVMARALVVYVLYLVKAHVQQCGKNTDVCLIGGGRESEMLSRGDVVLLESRVAQVLEAQTLLGRLAFGAASDDPRKAAESIVGFLLAIRQDYLNTADLRVENVWKL